MKIKDSVNKVNEFLISRLNDACGESINKSLIYGISPKRLIQNDKSGNSSSFLPVPLESDTPITIHSDIDLLIFHRLLGGGNISKEVFGGLQLGMNSHNLRMVVVTNSIDVFDNLFMVFQEGIYDLIFDTYSLDTERILRDELGFDVSQGKNYPANILAFTINYQLHE